MSPTLRSLEDLRTNPSPQRDNSQDLKQSINQSLNTSSSDVGSERRHGSLEREQKSSFTRTNNSDSSLPFTRSFTSISAPVDVNIDGSQFKQSSTREQMKVLLALSMLLFRLFDVSCY